MSGVKSFTDNLRGDERGEYSLFVCALISFKLLTALVLSSHFNQTRHRVMTTKGINRAQSLKIH